MLSVADLLQPAPTPRSPTGATAADGVYARLADPKRRALVRAIGLGEVPVRELRARYGRSWASAQSDLRALVNGGYVLSRGLGPDEVLCLDLGAFPFGMLENLVDVPAARRPRRAALRAAA